MRMQGRSVWQPVAVVVLAAGLNGGAQTTNRIAETHWQPTRAAVRVEEYAGSSACAACHRKESEKQMLSEMGRSVARPAETPLLREHAEMSFERSPYTYVLRTEGGRTSFTASDGKNKITEPVYLVVGSGTVFQAYLIQHGGAYYRVAADYFAAQGKLGPDPEATAELPATLETALGRRIDENGLHGCLRCHSRASVVGDHVETVKLTPGIGCEVCHGPGARHVAAMRTGKPQEAAIFNPARLSAEDKTAFCNDCHTSAQSMKEQKPQGVHGVVSPAYRLQGSRCWKATDARLSCTACHSPHTPLVRTMAAYDEKCLACHTVRGGAAARADQPGKTCPVGTRNCAGCHMTKIAVPNSPILFTDHRIRIAAAGAQYPE
jgi:hypothetical protein